MNKIDLPSPGPLSRLNLVAAEDVVPSVLAWHKMGLKFALITLVNTVGRAPRAIGSLMAVSSEGHHAGYLSGGCLERAVTIEAQHCIKSGRNRLVRYGKDSPYFDIQLPCGSGIDVFIDQGIDIQLLSRLDDLSQRRTAFLHATDLETGSSSIAALEENQTSRLDGHVFKRAVLPAIKVYLAGAGPAVPAIAYLLSTIGFAVDVFSPDEATRADVGVFGITCHPLTKNAIDALHGDPWSAAILAFHDHQWEIALLEQLLVSSCFYIGVLGSKSAAEERIGELRARGMHSNMLARIHTPIGLIPGTKSRLSLAVSIVAQLVGEAKNCGLLA